MADAILCCVTVGKRFAGCVGKLLAAPMTGITSTAIHVVLTKKKRNPGSMRGNEILIVIFII